MGKGNAGEMALLTLLTDFGTRDSYVAVMKGTIAQIDPTLQVIDLTHEIAPQDIASARFCLSSAYPYFPVGTVHIGVVDPGVGSRRRAIALQLENGFLVGPDNGLFSGVLEQFAVLAAVELTDPAYWRSAQTSATFHGRDIFAPVGAHLARGVPFAAVGTAIDPASLTPLPLPAVRRTDRSWVGCIQAIDRFGNLITNIPGDGLPSIWSVAIDSGAIDPVTIPSVSTYAGAAIGTLLALVGSHGWVEIAVNCGNAQAQLNLAIGHSVTVQSDMLDA